jgi:hypothetical protein
MKKSIYLLSFMVMTMLTAFTFTSCSEEDVSTTATYYWTVEGDNAYSVMLIQADYIVAFNESLGVSSSPFTLDENSKTADSKVLAACAKADVEASKESMLFEITVTVKNLNTDKVIYTKTYGK